MTEREQIRRVCAWNRKLARENAGLLRDVRHLAAENRKLAQANARLGVQAEAGEVLLEAAMDEAAEVGQR